MMFLLLAKEPCTRNKVPDTEHPLPHPPEEPIREEPPIQEPEKAPIIKDPSPQPKAISMFFEIPAFA